MPTEYRTIDGSNNNIENPSWGSAGTPLMRLIRVGYVDGKSEMPDRGNPRNISNIVCSQDQKTTNSKNATDHFWVWGQFLDHDLDIAFEASPTERADIQIPKGDKWFDVAHTGTKIIPVKRSNYLTGTDGIRQQINSQSSFLDASNVYGATEVRAKALRMNDGTGRLKTGPEGLLPYNEPRLPNALSTSSSFYLAGDIRANEQVLLTAYHAIWVKEHNRIALELYHKNPNQSGETLYQEARSRVIALNQIITYKEFLPILLGSSALSQYSGYDSSLEPGIFNVFSTAAYRLGHSLVPSQFLRLDKNLKSISAGPLKLREAFFNPSNLLADGGIEPLLRGAAKQVCEKLDVMTVNDLRNFLFVGLDQGSLDLASLNIQRGRDHGLPSYNDAREDLGLERKSSFEEINSTILISSRLAAAYDSVDDIDIWIGGLAENAYQNSMLGELFTTICKKQFELLRDSDRFWYANVFSGDELDELENTKWSDVIRRNTLINSEIQDDIFTL